MNDELKQALAEFVKHLLEVANTGLDTASQQMPLVLQDIVGAAILSATVWWWVWLCVTILGAALAITTILVAVIAKKPDAIAAAVFTCILTIVLSLILAVYWYDYYYAVNFPRLVIIDYLKRMM